MMLLLRPSRTKYVPMIEVRMHTPPTMSGSVITASKWSAFFSASAIEIIVTPMVTT